MAGADLRLGTPPVGLRGALFGEYLIATRVIFSRERRRRRTAERQLNAGNAPSDISQRRASLVADGV
jgi:hypothetical protein